MKHMLKCKGCGIYTFQETCSCGQKAISPHPAKYSPEDKYGEYRRQAKAAVYKEKGYL